MIHNDIVSTKIYDKQDDFNFDIVNFPFLDGDVPQRPSYGVYISQLIRFARASSLVTDFNSRIKFLTAKLLEQGYRYHKLCKAFSKFYRRHFELIEKYHVSLKKLMQHGICNPEFYGDLVYTVSHFSYAPLFQGPHFLTKMLESNIFLNNLLIDIFFCLMTSKKNRNHLCESFSFA